MKNQFAGQVQEGMEVWSMDGHKLGKVVAIHAGTFVVEKGFFFPRDYTISCSTISEIREGKLHLTRRRDELGVKPGVVEPREAPLPAAARLEREEMGGVMRGETREEIRVPLHAEEVHAHTHTKEVGEIRVRKEVLTEERQITVPVMHEVVTVNRVPATLESARARAEGEEVFREETISVPIREEVIDIEKHPVVTEEIRISKSTVQEMHPVSTTVRREVAEIEQPNEEELVQRRKAG